MRRGLLPPADGVGAPPVYREMQRLRRSPLALVRSWVPRGARVGVGRPLRHGLVPWQGSQATSRNGVLEVAHRSRRSRGGDLLAWDLLWRRRSDAPGAAMALRSASPLSR